MFSLLQEYGYPTKNLFHRNPHSLQYEECYLVVKLQLLFTYVIVSPLILIGLYLFKIISSSTINKIKFVIAFLIILKKNE